MEVARLMRIPIELIDFHIWYLKEKGWIERLENGQLAITASGVDQVESGRLRLTPDRLLTAHVTDRERDEGMQIQSLSDPFRSMTRIGSGRGDAARIADSLEMATFHSVDYGLLPGRC